MKCGNVRHTFCRYTQNKTRNKNKKQQSGQRSLARHTPFTLFCKILLNLEAVIILKAKKNRQKSSFFTQLTEY